MAPPSSHIKITVSDNPEALLKLRLVGKYKPQLDQWATSDETEEKAVSELTYTKCLGILYSIMRLITMILVFLLTLAAGVFSRGLTFFMVSQLSDQEIPLCSPTLTPQDNSTNLPIFQHQFASNTPLEKVALFLICFMNFSDQVAWLWCIFFAFAFPEALRLLKSLNSCISQSAGFLSYSFGSLLVHFFARFLNWRFLVSFLVYAFLEACHVIGLGILFFYVLPR